MLFFRTLPPLLAFCTFALAQIPGTAPPTPQNRISALLNQPPGAWNKEQLANMDHLRDAALRDSYAVTELRHLTDNIGPRLAGSPQAEQAVQYVAAEMRALGADVQLEKTSVPHWVRGIETGALTKWNGQAPGTVQQIVLTALGGSVSTQPDGLLAEVVVADSFDDLKRLPAGSVRGKILLFNEHFDKALAAEGKGGEAYGQAVIYRGAGPAVASSLGAAAVLVRSVGGADYRLPHTGMTYYPEGAPKIPAAAVTAEDADLLANLTRQGPVQMRLTLTPQSLPRVDSYNVIGGLERQRATGTSGNRVRPPRFLGSCHRRNRRRRRHCRIHAGYSPFKTAQSTSQANRAIRRMDG